MNTNGQNTETLLINQNQTTQDAEVSLRKQEALRDTSNQVPSTKGHDEDFSGDGACLLQGNVKVL